MSLILACALLPSFVPPAQSTIKERVADHVYFRQGGAAFTYDVFKPTKPNGIAMVWVVSGGWVSNHNDMSLELAEAACKRGLTIIQVVHGAQPLYKMETILESIHRAVKDVRMNAKLWGVDPMKIGISGGSAGGHLSLMIATQGVVPTGSDVLLKTSSEVQSCAVFFPPTDFLNWGAPGVASFKNPLLRGAFGGTFSIDPKTPEEKLMAISKQFSPASYASAKMPPTLLVHGDKDTLVPVQQSRLLKEKMDSFGVTNELVVVPGEGHGWKNMDPQIAQILDWHIKTLL